MFACGCQRVAGLFQNNAVTIALQCLEPALVSIAQSKRAGASEVLCTYSPYNVTMRKIAANVEARHVIAPESGITTENTNKGHTNSRRRTKVTKRKQVAAATSRIPVSRAVWAELSGLRKPGQTYDHLLEEMIEQEKKKRLFEDMDRIEKRGKFVPMKW